MKPESMVGVVLVGMRLDRFSVVNLVEVGMVEYISFSIWRPTTALACAGRHGCDGSLGLSWPCMAPDAISRPKEPGPLPRAVGVAGHDDELSRACAR